jgi:DNA-binding response OmpR family regulator
MKKLHKVAIVDPHEELARAYQKRLSIEGFEVYVFNNAQAAVSIMIDLPFDAIITEYQLPDMSYADFYDSMQSINDGYNMPIIVLSSNDTSGPKGWRNLNEIENYFVKSKTHPNDIIDRLRYLLRIEA